SISYDKNSDNFIFDNQVVAQVFFKGFEIGEVTCPTKYFPEASSINFGRSLSYGWGVVGVSFRYRLAKWGIAKPKYLRNK
ncbi:MAG TPA: hypothetical protein VLJ68_06600, partial [Chitinophagaceae bacterium]|nr:hypothetical protein [Chitinophagaceae bacterium]